MKLLSLFLTISLTCSLNAMAQQDAYHWRIGAYSGVMNYYGDLNQRLIAPDNAIITNTFDALSYGVSLEKSLSRSWSTKLLYTTGKFYANDRAVDWKGNADADRSNYGRSLNARTDIQDLSVIFTYYFDNDVLLGRRAFISPYLTFGAGVTNFEVFGDLFDGAGNRYYYWSDNTIRNESETSGSGDAVIIDQHGNYETNLTDLQTERKYKTNVINIPFGVGLKFRLSSRINLNLDFTARYAFTDYLDDVSGNYRQAYDNELQEYASNPTGQDMERRGTSERNDFYSFASVSLHFNFGKKTDKYTAPRIYPSSDYSMAAPTREWERDPLRYKAFRFDSVSTRILRVPVFEDFNPLPVKLDSSSVFNTEVLKKNDEAGQETTVLQTLTTSAKVPGATDKYALQEDTIRQLEYEIKKIKLQRELDELRKSSADSSVTKSIREDSIRNSTSSLRESPPLDSIEAKELVVQGAVMGVDTSSTSQVSTSDETPEIIPVPVDTAEIVPASVDLAQNPPVSIDTAQNLQNTTPESEDADPIKYDNMQSQIDELKRALDSESDANQSAQESDDVAQLRREIDALSYELRNTRRVTRVIQRDPGPTYQNQADGSTIALIAIERRLRLLSDEVRAARPNYTGANAVAQDPTTARYIQDANKKEAELNVQIDTLNQQLQAAASREDSVNQSRITAERDSLRNQVARLQESLAALKSAKPDTVERAVITIPKLPKTEVFFPVNSFALTANDVRRVKEVASIIAKYPQVAVTIRGFTDKTGSIKYNLMLSEKRARAVEAVLTSSNVSPARISMESNGIDNQLIKKASQYGRRVEIILSSDTANQ